MKLLFKLFISFSIFLLLFLIFKPWVFTNVIAAGDFWYFFQEMFDNYSLHPYAWSLFASNGMGGQGYIYQNGLIMSAVFVSIANILNISWENTSKLIFILFVFLSFFSSTFFIKKILPNNKFWIFGSLIFTLNTYVLMLVGGGQILTALSYAIMPFTVYSFIKLSRIEKNDHLESTKYILISTLLLSLQTLLDLRIGFITLIIISLYLLFTFWEKGFIQGLKILILYSISFIILFLINIYWILPIFYYGIDPIQNLGASYSSSNIVKFLSFASLENSFALLHPYWPENVFGKIGFMKPEFILLPVIAFSSLIFYKDKKEFKFVIFFSVIALFGIFLGKGTNEPLGNLYLVLFENIPGFQLFRDSFKWYTLIAFAFSILIPYSLNKISGAFDYRLKINFTSYILSGIFVIYILFLLKPAIMGDLKGTFSVRSVPLEYSQLAEYLSKDKEFFRTYWIPNTSLFGYYSNNHLAISGKDALNEYDDENLIKKFKKESTRNILGTSSVKYVIIPFDSENEIFLTDRKYDDKKYKNTIEYLNNISWLKKEKQFGKIIVYRNENYKKHFWCECKAEIIDENINPSKYKLKIRNAKKDDVLVFSETFDKNWIVKNNIYQSSSIPFQDKYNSFLIPEGDSELEIYYSSQELVDFGTKISIITLVMALFILIFSLVFKRKK